MYTDSEGIILRQVKTTNGRRMVLLFSRKYGKISAGSSINEKGRSKAALAMRPFTFGRYEFFKNRDTYNINSAEAIKSFYKIGEDVDKYMCASYVLEFTDKLLIEEQPVPALFDMLVEFFDMLSERKSKYETLVIGYMIKAMAIMGTVPELSNCVICGSSETADYFSVKDGGIVCRKCSNNLVSAPNASLIFKINADIIGVLKYFLSNPLGNLKKIGLDDDIQKELRALLRSYGEYHLDIKRLKSESFFEQC
ncbi:MAG: DNA repair protein RecO [Firmicutes bacterium]|nr:DNA repair protein RecO [Bacillota bacterium]MBQ9971920.1 DNA repair protein RecO [Bacillota bacterium]